MRLGRERWTGILWVCLALGATSTTTGAAAAATPEPPAATAAAPADEVARLREALEALRQEYAGRIATLEERLAALEKSQSEAATAAPAAPADAGVAAAAPVASSKVFNPDIAVIGNFVGAAGKTPGGGEPSLSLQESEFSFQAVVDPYARADFFLTFGPEEVGVEEGYLTFPALPGGLLGKVGKMREAFGRVNTEHPHTLPFADLPLLSRGSSRRRGSSSRRRVRSSAASPTSSGRRRAATCSTRDACAPTGT